MSGGAREREGGQGDIGVMDLAGEGDWRWEVTHTHKELLDN